MIVYGYIVYLILAAILWHFWKCVHGRTFDDLLRESAREHHQIQDLHREHPHGGTWKEFNRWLAP